jgi:lysozyme
MGHHNLGGLMQASEEIQEFIKGFETLCLQSYLPTPNDRPTIGYGATVYPNGQPVQMGEVITSERAEEIFSNDMEHFSQKVEELLQIEVTQNQFDALVSFTYNVGVTNLKTSTLLKKLNASDIDGAADEFPKWNKQAGKVLKGLVKRRKAEQEWFLKD